MNNGTSEVTENEDTSYVQPFNEQEVAAWTLAIGLTMELTRATNAGTAFGVTKSHARLGTS